MKHEMEMGGQPLHESDGAVIGTMTDSRGFVHDLTECKFCGVKMSRPQSILARLKLRPAEDETTDARVSGLGGQMKEVVVPMLPAEWFRELPDGTIVVDPDAVARWVDQTRRGTEELRVAVGTALMPTLKSCVDGLQNALSVRSETHRTTEGE